MKTALAFENVERYRADCFPGKLRFIDLFAGIGGFHLAMHSLGLSCVFASEWDKFARATYEKNLRVLSPELFDSGRFAGDITQVDVSKIPDFEILCAGFPCQPFSQAGFKRGFEEIRGTLFFDIVRIIEAKRPRAFLLENVRHLKNHDNGNTFARIKAILTNELGYSFHSAVLKASDFGLPQLRPRLIMVGFRDHEPFAFPMAKPLDVTMSDIFGAPCSRDVGFTLRVGGRGSGLSDRRNWDGYLVNGTERRIGPSEGLKMQGFPDDFVFPVSDVQAMKQLGNSVAVPLIKAVAQQMLKSLGRT